MDKLALLDQVEKNVKNCTKCRLCKQAQNAVPGEGNPNAELIFIGEAPGANEDRTGRPFVGRAGALLDKLLKEIDYERKDVWIGNIIKHRPPQNRDPLADEIKACVPYLDLQLKALDPVLIVTLGRFAMNHFYKDGKISRDHGSLFNVNGVMVFPVYHPAAALRNPSYENVLRADFGKIPKIIEEIKNKRKEKMTVDQDVSSVNDGQLGLGF